MPGKISILIALLLSLLVAPLAQWTPQPVRTKMPGCAMTTCIHGCCAMMPCCTKTAREQQSQPVQSPVSSRADLQVADAILPVLSLFRILPVPARTFAILDEASTGHALPPRVANCIQLI
jgi:hypothetical protein